MMGDGHYLPQNAHSMNSRTKALVHESVTQAQRASYDPYDFPTALDKIWLRQTTPRGASDLRSRRW
jgi:hypothetical protein